MAECELRKANHVDGAPCDGHACIYWRAVEHLDLPETPADGCAVKHFELLAGGNPTLAEWLLSVKDRVERTGEG